jgi:5,10-methylenetetrahydromethanopterin reductase
MEDSLLTYAVRLPPGPTIVEHARLAEDLGFERVWSPETPAYGHDVWIALARVAEQTRRIAVGAAVVVPSYRHPLAQASAIATVEQLAPGRLWVGFGTGFTGRSGLGQKPLSMRSMGQYMRQVRALLNGEQVPIGDGVGQFLALPGWLPDRPIRVPLLLAAQGPKGRQLAHEVADGLISLSAPDSGFEICLTSVNGVVLAPGEDLDTPRVRKAVAPLVAAAYHSAYARDPEAVLRLPNGDAWLAKVRELPAEVRHLSVHRGHVLEIDSPQDELIDLRIAKQVSFTGTPDELRARLEAFEDGGATGIIFGTSGIDVPREFRAFAEAAGL